MYPKPLITVYIDNREVIERVTKKNQMKHNAKFYPLSAELLHYNNRIISNIRWKWIKGHQNTISIPTYLNNLADQQSQKFRKNSTTTPKWHQITSHTGLLKYQDLPIMCLKNILWAQATDQLLMYFADKWNIKQNHLYKIDWYAFSWAIKKMSPNQAIQITKISANWLPTNNHLEN